MTNKVPKEKTAILGGTFDPPHKGHLNVAVEACEQLNIRDITLLPCHIPALKSSPKVNSQHRLNMLKLAIDGRTEFSIDTRELRHDSTSYTVNTLEAFKNEKPDSTLFFIIGTDNLLTFEQWHRWQDILNLCHLIVCRRAKIGSDNPPSLQQLNSTLKDCLITDTQPCELTSSGCIYLAQTDLIDVSSTNLRAALSRQEDVSHWLEPEVYNYIKQHALY